MQTFANEEDLHLLEALRKQDELEENLPHAYQRHWKWYKWAKDFYDSMNPVCVLCAANQISKSSTMIRKHIEWATNKRIWKKAWDHEPRIFWYFYPTLEIGSVEIKSKWVPDFMPRGPLIHSPTWGYELDIKNKQVQAIHWRSGVSTFLKSYEITSTNLQSASVDLLCADEELPEALFPELMARVSATDGYFWTVYTATLGQEMWRRVTEEKGEFELMPDAFKRQISMYDCQRYIDGTPGRWPIEKIERQKKIYATDEEIGRRVYGKFILDADREYPGYSPKRNLKKPHRLPKTWLVYAGIDVGSGTGHPPAVVFCSVSPDFKQGRIFRAWRGDNTDMIAGDVLDKYLELSADLTVVHAVYDWASSDFGKIAQRRGIPIGRANKSRDVGIQLVNTLYKNEILAIHDNEETQKLSSEMVALKRNAKKNTAKDDLCDAQRYCLMQIPWDWSVLDVDVPKVEETEALLTDREKRARDEKDQNSQYNILDSEIDEFNYYLEEFGGDNYD